MASLGALNQVNWLSVFVAASAAFAFGAVWYGPWFGAQWMAASGIDPGRAGQVKMGRLLGLTLVLQLLAASLLALWIAPGGGIRGGVTGGVFMAAWIGIGLGVVYLFEQRPLAHWLVNAGYLTAASLLMGAVLALWP